MHVQRPSRQVLTVLATVAGMAAAVLLYYYLRVKANETYLTDRNFRVLAVTSRQLQESLETIGRMLQADLEQALADAGCQPKDAPRACRQDLQASLDRVLEARRQAIPESKAEFDRGSDAEPGATPGFAASIGHRNTIEIAYSAESGDVRHGVVTMRARVHLDRWIEPFLIAGVFDTVLILDDRSPDSPGRVLLAVPPDLQLLQIARDEPTPPTGARPTSAEPGGHARGPAVFTVEIANRKYKAFHQALKFEWPERTRPSGPRRENADVGLPISICGLVQGDHFASESLALNPYWIVALALVIVAGTLAYPFLKVALMGPAERIRAHDLAFLALSLLLATALATMVAIDLTSYFSSDVGRIEATCAPGNPKPATAGSALVGLAQPQDVDAQLEMLACGIESSWNAELGDALDTLFTFAALPASTVIALPRETLFKPGTQHLAESIAARVDSDPRVEYPFFTNIFWVDSRGSQSVRWSAGPSRGSLLDVGDRDYFINALEDRLWTRTKDHNRFFVEPVWSRITAQLVAVASTRTNKPDDKANENAVVAAIGIKALSVIQPVLPAGFGFAILGEDGTTLFHSDQKHTLAENFFQECDDDAAVRAAASAGVRDHLNAKYWGRDHRFLVAPVRGFPWSMVVFYRKDLLRTVHLELLTLAVFLYVGLLVCLTLFAFLARLSTGWGGERWLWPHTGALGRYLGLSLVLLLMAVAAFHAAATYPPALCLIACFSLPLAALGLTAAILGASDGGRPPLSALGLLVGLPLGFLVVAATQRRAWLIALEVAVIGAAGFAVALRWPVQHKDLSTARPALRVAYVGWAILTVCVLAAAPSYGFFRLSWERQMELLVRHGQLDLATRLDPLDRDVDKLRRRLAGEAKDSEPWAPGALRTGSGLERQAGYTYLYENAFYETRIDRLDHRSYEEHPRPVVSRRILDRLASLMPFYNDHSISLRRLGGDDAEDGRWHAEHTTETPSNRLGLQVRRASDHGAYTISSRAPTLNMLSRPAPWLALVAASAGLTLLLLFLVRRLFLVEFSDPENKSLAALAEAPIRANLFVTCPPLARKDLFLRRPDLFVVDLAGPAPTAADLRAMDSTHPHAKIICFNRFEQAVRVPAKNLALLHAFESIIDTQGLPLVILSELEPGMLLLGDEERQRRWARLLGRFMPLFGIDPGDMEFRSVLADIERECLEKLDAAQGPPGSPARMRVREFFKTIGHECAAHHQLQIIGRQLAVEAAATVSAFPAYDRARVVRLVRERADNFYRALWLSLWEQEKLLLTQLAHGHLVNPRSGRALSRLLAHGLIVRSEVGFRLVNASLARFIRSTARPEEIEAWEREGAVSLWAQIRTPILICLVGGAGVLVYTLRDVVPPLIAGLGAVVPALVKLFDLLRPAVARGEAGR